MFVKGFWLDFMLVEDFTDIFVGWEFYWTVARVIFVGLGFYWKGLEILRLENNQVGGRSIRYYITKCIDIFGIFLIVK